MTRAWVTDNEKLPYNGVMRIACLYRLFLILCLGISGCVSTPFEPDKETPPPEPADAPEPAHLPASKLDPSAPTIATDEPEPTQFLPSPSVTSQHEPEAEVCSPLGEHALFALPEIISSAYTAPPVGREERHHGVDFSYYHRGERESIAGEAVQAILDGSVALVLSDSFPYGNAVILETHLSDLPGSWSEKLAERLQEYRLANPHALQLSVYFLYAHLQDPPSHQAGQHLSACTTLGAVGQSGNAGVAHLHLEMRLGPSGAQLEDMGYYLYEITPAQRESYLRWRISGEFRHFDPMLLLTTR